MQQIKRLISQNLLLPMQMECEPEFCRDVLETRVKQVFREALRISRDIPFTQVRKDAVKRERLVMYLIDFRSTGSTCRILIRTRFGRSWSDSGRSRTRTTSSGSSPTLS